MYCWKKVRFIKKIESNFNMLTRLCKHYKPLIPVFFLSLWHNIYIMIPILFAIVSFVGWGTGDIFTALAARKIGSYNASIYGYLFGALLASFYIPFALNSLKFINVQTVLLILLLSIIQLFAFLAYNEGLRVGNASLVGTIAGSFTSIVVILSLIFLGEKLSTSQAISIMVIFLGLIVSSIKFDVFKDRHAWINRGTILALLAMAGWAIYFTFIKIPVQKVGFFWPSYITSISGAIFFLIFGLKRIKMPTKTLNSGFIAVFASGVLLTIGSFAFNFAIGQSLSSIVAPIAGAYPALFALLAYILFKDPINKQQKIGMTTTLIGIILLGYFSR